MASFDHEPLTELSPECLANAAAKLLDMDILNEPVMKEGYRLQVRYVDKKWRMELKLNVWELVRLSRTLHMEEAEFANKVEEYCKGVLENPLRHSDDDVTTSATPKQKPCNHGENCNVVKGSGRCPMSMPPKLHSVQCKEKDCTFDVPTICEVKTLDLELEFGIGMYFRVRDEDVGNRDFLVMRGASAGKPHYNHELAQSPAFWNATLKLLEQLCKKTGLNSINFLESMHFNFGRWETGTQRNPNIGCHGHLHLIPTVEGATKLSTLDSAFTGWTHPPRDDHHIADCERAMHQFITPRKLCELDKKIDQMAKENEKRHKELVAILAELKKN